MSPAPEHVVTEMQLMVANLRSDRAIAAKRLEMAQANLVTAEERLLHAEVTLELMLAGKEPTHEPS